jgi:hypothetical protein
MLVEAIAVVIRRPRSGIVRVSADVAQFVAEDWCNDVWSIMIQPLELWQFLLFTFSQGKLFLLLTRRVASC